MPPILYLVPSSLLATLIAFVWYEAASTWFPAKDAVTIVIANDNPTTIFLNKLFTP
jgi:hypothetical protein